MISNHKIYFWRCPYIKFAKESAKDFRYDEAGAYCSLGKTDFGQCDRCEIFKDINSWLKPSE